MSQFEETSDHEDKAFAKRRGVEIEGLFIAGVEKSDFCQDDISQSWDYT
jgi:hypothetical protein